MRLVHHNCVICGSECPPIADDVPTNPRDGGIITIGFGYGSRHDTEHYYGVICDTCAMTLIDTAASRFHSDGSVNRKLKNTLDTSEL